ncbi:hypothetical protein [Lactococcus protaetiae]|uniref:WxL domain-containing protein n=1 Tax=Lactococcus protaetiae TaxID=2592653 RepID=A0A514Z5J9_9LACT|nr:hypothetical protein [Lactococcus protaetiae]QDK69865.1 hypothetical protein FLP15_00055 [Lactococcus protaetiae]
MKRNVKQVLRALTATAATSTLLVAPLAPAVSVLAEGVGTTAIAPTATEILDFTYGSVPLLARDFSVGDSNLEMLIRQKLDITTNTLQMLEPGETSWRAGGNVSGSFANLMLAIDNLGIGSHTIQLRHSSSTAEVLNLNIRIAQATMSGEVQATVDGTLSHSFNASNQFNLGVLGANVVVGAAMRADVVETDIANAITVTVNNANVPGGTIISSYTIDWNKANVDFTAAQRTQITNDLNRTTGLGGLIGMPVTINAVDVSAAGMRLKQGATTGDSIEVVLDITNTTALQPNIDLFKAQQDVKYTIKPAVVPAGETEKEPVTKTVKAGQTATFTDLDPNKKYDITAEFTGPMNFNLPTVTLATTISTPEHTLRSQFGAHVQGLGDMDKVGHGEIIGTTGQALRLEQVTFQNIHDGKGGTFNFEVEAHLQGKGDVVGTSASGVTTVGTTGEMRRMEGISIQLPESMRSTHRVFYRVHLQGTGWSGVFSDGQFAGTRGESRRLEAIEVHVVEQDAPNPFVASIK